MDGPVFRPAPGPRARTRSGAPALRVAVVDDHPLVRDHLGTKIAGAPDMELVAAVACVTELLCAAENGAAPDVVLLDLHLKEGVEGPEGVATVCARGWAVLVVSHSDADEAVLGALAAGARGYVTKTETVEEILHAVRVVAAGDDYLAPSLAGLVLAGEDPAGGVSYGFTAGELELLDLVAQGLTDREIARKACKAVGTVQNQMNAVAAKIRARRGPEAWARKRRALLQDVAEEIGVRRTRH